MCIMYFLRVFHYLHLQCNLIHDLFIIYVYIFAGPAFSAQVLWHRGQRLLRGLPHPLVPYTVSSYRTGRTLFPLVCHLFIIILRHIYTDTEIHFENMIFMPYIIIIRSRAWLSSIVSSDLPLQLLLHCMRT